MAALPDKPQRYDTPAPAFSQPSMARHQNIGFNQGMSAVTREYRLQPGNLEFAPVDRQARGPGLRLQGVARRVDVIRHQRFGPERNSDFSNPAGGEEAGQLPCRQQGEILHASSWNMRAQQAIVLAPERAGQKLDEGQVVVTFEGEPVVWSGHKPALAHSHDLTGEFHLAALARDVLNHGVRKNHVEALVREGKGAAVKQHVARPGMKPPSAQDLAE